MNPRPWSLLLLALPLALLACERQSPSAPRTRPAAPTPGAPATRPASDRPSTAPTRPDTRPAPTPATRPSAATRPRTRTAPATRPRHAAALAEAERIAEAGRFGEAYHRLSAFRDRMARNLSSEAERAVRRRLYALRSRRERAARLEPAIDQLAAHPEIAGRRLERGGAVGRALLRRAVREAPPATAAEAARLLGRIGDAPAARTLVGRLLAGPPESLRRAIAAGLANLAHAIPPAELRRLLDRVAEDPAFARRACAGVLVAAFREAGGDCAAFDGRLSRDGACGVLAGYVRRALRADDETVVRWASRHAAALGLLPLEGLALWFEAGAAELDGAGRVERWPSRRPVDGVAAMALAQPEPGRRPAPGGGAGLRFDGEDDYLITPDLAPAVPKDTMTLAVWFRAEAGGVIATELGSRKLNQSHHDSQIEVVGDEVRVRVWSLAPVTMGPVTHGRWHHVVLRYDGENRVLDAFLDGERAETRSEGPRDRPSPLHYAFGATESTNMGDGGYFRGRLGGICFYRRALTADEVERLHRATRPVVAEGEMGR